LPVVPLPLRPGDDDVPLDLAAAFTSVYDSVGYDLLIDYTKRPDIPFDKGTATVAQQILGESTRSIQELLRNKHLPSGRPTTDDRGQSAVVGRLAHAVGYFAPSL
jgi:hypothetical protein